MLNLGVLVGVLFAAYVLFAMGVAMMSMVPQRTHRWRASDVWHYMAAKDHEDQFVVVEYYPQEGGWTGGIAPYGDTKQELIEVLQIMINDLRAYTEILELTDPAAEG